MKSYAKIFGENLDTVLYEKGISFNKLAQLINKHREGNKRKVTKAMLNDYARGKKQIRIYNFFSICAALGVSPDKMIDPTKICKDEFKIENFPWDRTALLETVLNNLEEGLEKEKISWNDFLQQMIDVGRDDIADSTLWRYFHKPCDMPLENLITCAEVLNLDLVKIVQP